MGTEKTERKRKREWLVFLFFLPLGIAAMLYVGQAAISQPPVWSVQANMVSYIDPNVYREQGRIAPLRADIMTQPAWANTYLTPQSDSAAATASSQGGAGVTATPSQLATATDTGTQLPTATVSLTPPNTPIPTNTLFYLPPTNTPIPPPPTNTSIPPTPTNTNTPLPPTATNTAVPSVELSITKDDWSAPYTVGSFTTYTIIVTNNGPDDIVGAQISDYLPVQITSWDWACTALINASGCDPVTASTTSFTDTVDIQNGGSITYTVTAYISSSASGDLINTATISGGTDTNLANNTASDIDTPQRIADLVISKNAPTDVYRPNDVIAYTVIVSNNGPSNVTGFDISDSVPVELTGVSVSCVASGGNASCGTNASSGNNISFTGASLGTGGETLSLSISGTVAGGTTADITNPANIVIPTGANFTDSNLGNNFASHTHQRIYDLPYGEIGDKKDDSTTSISSGSSVILNINTQVNGHPSWDLVYYELPNGCGIAMDWVILQVGDGTNWYTVLNWGDGIVDSNTSITSQGLPESDNRVFCSPVLYDSTGIAINLDGIVPPGTYPYIRIISPVGDVDGVVEVDAITPLP